MLIYTLNLLILYYYVQTLNFMQTITTHQIPNHRFNRISSYNEMSLLSELWMVFYLSLINSILFVAIYSWESIFLLIQQCHHLLDKIMLHSFPRFLISMKNVNYWRIVLYKYFYIRKWLDIWNDINVRPFIYLYALLA